MVLRRTFSPCGDDNSGTRWLFVDAALAAWDMPCAEEDREGRDTGRTCVREGHDTCPGELADVAAVVELPYHPESRVSSRSLEEGPGSGNNGGQNISVCCRRSPMMETATEGRRGNVLDILPAVVVGSDTRLAAVDFPTGEADTVRDGWDRRTLRAASRSDASLKATTGWQYCL